MNKLLQALAHLSGLTDRQAMDFALTTLMLHSDLWACRSARLLRAVGQPTDQRWFILAELDLAQTSPKCDDFWADPTSLPHLADVPQREAAILSETVICTGQGPFLTLFPIDTQAQVCSLLELASDAALDPDTQALVNGVLQIYKNLQGQLDYSERDTLTELLNRKTFDRAFLRAAQARALPPSPGHSERRHPSAQGNYWLAVIDIDHFKHVNDSFGHLIGDEVLLLLARQMRLNFRQQDQLYRFGGEEFVVLMRCADHQDAERALERFRRQIAQHAFPQVGHITISIGFAPLRDNDTPSGAFDRADKAVYYAKSHGRNQICSFTTLVASGELMEHTDGSEEVDFF